MRKPRILLVDDDKNTVNGLKNIIQAHGGNIRFRNLKKGAEFIIDLPIS